jgi:hypothetical protein
MKLRLIIAFVFALAFCSLTQAQQRPLITEDVDIIPPGSLRFEAGIDFTQRNKFPVSGLRGDLTKIGVIGVSIGLSPNVELQVEGTLQNFLSINSYGTSAIPLNVDRVANSTNDTGDFTIWTKIKLRNETKRAPSIGFRVGVGLPNSNQARGIGVNQVNAYGMVLLGKKLGKENRLNTFANLGIGIFTSPLERFSQNDMLLYGIAGIFRVNKQFNIAAEINGRANTRNSAAPLGTEPYSEFRLGAQIKASGLRFDFAGIAGLTKFSPRSGITFGVTYDTPSIFTPVK